MPSLHASSLQLSKHLIPTNQPGDVGEWPYEQIGGSVTFKAKQMPQVSAPTSPSVHCASQLNCKASLDGTNLLSCNFKFTQDAVSWDALNYIQLCWSAQYLLASHVCSYSCWTSQWVPDAADVSNCWLSSMPEGAAGSYCFLWPSDYPGMQAGARVGIQAGCLALCIAEHLHSLLRHFYLGC